MKTQAKKNEQSKLIEQTSSALKPIQFRIPRDIFEEFSEQAGKEYGFSHGSKKQLFLKIWFEYKNNSMK